LSNILKDIGASVYFISPFQDLQVENANCLYMPNFSINDELETLCRLTFLYSNPDFEYLIIFYDNKLIDLETINETITLLSENNYINNNVLFATTRSYVAFNGFNFSEPFISMPEDPLGDIMNINLALEGKPVEEKYFILALNELLPEHKIKTMCSFNDINLNNYLRSKNIISEATIYAIDDLDSFDKSQMSKKDIILYFTYQKQELNHMMAIYRSDGFIAYILRK
jgi:hypothetical protein